MESWADWLEDIEKEGNCFPEVKTDQSAIIEG
jgi:hypothetical protein